MKQSKIPPPCLPNCPNRSATCRLECKKYEVYSKLKKKEEEKKAVAFKNKHYVSPEEKFKVWLKEVNKSNRNASNYFSK